MKRLSIAITAIVLSGCAVTGTEGVVEIGPNTYMLGGQGGRWDHSGSAVKARFFKEAAKYCSDKGMTIVPLNSTGQDAYGISYASAEVQFRCVVNKQ